MATIGNCVFMLLSRWFTLGILLEFALFILTCEAPSFCDGCFLNELDLPKSYLCKSSDMILTAYRVCVCVCECCMFLPVRGPQRRAGAGERVLLWSRSCWATLTAWLARCCAFTPKADGLLFLRCSVSTSSLTPALAKAFQTHPGFTPTPHTHTLTHLLGRCFLASPHRIADMNQVPLAGRSGKNLMV